MLTTHNLLPLKRQEARLRKRIFQNIYTVSHVQHMYLQGILKLLYIIITTYSNNYYIVIIITWYNNNWDFLETRINFK